jgi:Protein of unknown function (DUF3450)
MKFTEWMLVGVIPPRHSLGLWTALLALMAPSVCAADPLKDADDSAGLYIRLQVEEARLNTEWGQQRGLLESLVRADEERAASLEASRDAINAKTAGSREELDGLRVKMQAASDDSKVLEARLNALCAKLLALRPSLPPRLSEALDVSFRTLAGTGAPLGDRMQVAMGVLNRCAQFNRMVTVGEDVLSLDGEPPEKSLEVIYWGLSHGYAVDRAARKAWLGSPGPTGWQWEAKPEVFDGAAMLIDIAHDKADPAYVSMPAAVARSLPAAHGN